MQRRHGLGNVLAGLFRTLRPLLWIGAKSIGKVTLQALGREALRTGTNIIRDIAENPPTQTTDIISKHASDSTQNIISCVGVALVNARELRKSLREMQNARKN